ncbi:MAG: AI-2E family transporter, partial [Candidatus Korobacteraceae bacterium]
TVTRSEIAVPEPLPAALEPPAPMPRGSGDRASSPALAILALVSVLAACYVAKLPIIVLLTSILLAYVLDPLVALLRRMRVPESASSAMAVFLFLGLLYGLLLVSYNRAVAFSQEMPKYSHNIQQVVEQFRSRAKQFQKTTETVLPGDAEERERPTVNVEQRTTIWSLLSGGLGPLWEVAFGASFIPFLTYFMLTWQNHVRSATVMLFPPESRHTAYVTVGLISRMVRGFLVGNLLIGLFMAGLSTLVFAYLRLPYFYFFGFISGFLSLIPYLGVVLAALPPLLAGLGQLPSSGLVMIAVTVVVLHLFALNVLYPKVLGGRMQLNPLVVTVFLLFWGWMWGAMGLMLAVPITAATKIVFDHVKPLRGYGAWLGE